ncbi:hypothetical protein EDB84DRAFT_345092 [Lactarius hengduanensis]|nr:hypothetical protein EDB84DRAFT_345092 [Lactarius hengduanensis]
MSRMSCSRPFLTSAFIIIFFEPPHAPIRASARPTELEKLLAQFRNGRLAPIHSGQPNWKQNSHKLRATVVGDRGPRQDVYGATGIDADARSVGDGASFHEKGKLCIDLFSLRFAQDDAIVAPTVPSTPIGRAGSISPDDTIAGLLQPRWRAPAHSLSASLDGQTIPPTRHRASTELPCSRGQLAPRRGTVGVLRIYVPRASRTGSS